MSLKKYLLIGFSILILIIIAIYPSDKPLENNKNESEINSSEQTTDIPKQDPTLSFENVSLDSMEKYISSLEKDPISKKETEKEVSLNNESEENTEQESKNKDYSEMDINVNSPQKRSAFYKNSEVPVRWNSSGNIDKIDILLKKFPFKCNGDSLCESLFYESNSYKYIANNIKNTGSFSWTIEGDIEPGKYKVEVNNSNPVNKIADTSDVFSISEENDQLSIKFPVDEYGLDQNKNHTIVWAGGISVFNLKIVLLDQKNDKEIVIAGKEKNDSVFVWNNTEDINGNTVPKGDYLLSIKSLSNNIKSEEISITIK